LCPPESNSYIISYVCFMCLIFSILEAILSELYIVKLATWAGVDNVIAVMHNSWHIVAVETVLELT